MNILYHHRIRSKDGQAVHLEELIAALRSLGAKITLSGPESFSRAEFGHDPKLLGKIKQMMPQGLYELIELLYNIPVYQRLARAFRTVRPDFVYERYNLHLLAGIWLKRRHGVPLLLEVNAPLAAERAEHDGLAFPRLAERLEAWTWRNADYVLPVTQVLADMVHKAGVPRERIVVIPNGVNLDRFGNQKSASDAKAELGLGGKTVLGFSGFMRDWHGLDQIVDWLADPATPTDIHLLLIGEGPALPNLQAQAARLGVTSRITFAGLAGRDRIAAMTAAFDIALQPKSVDYASPLKLFEYMVSAKAIVAPDQPNIREVLEDNVSAILFDPARPATLVDALGRLARDAALRAELGAGARRAIDERGFTWRHNAERVLALGARCLTGKQAAPARATVHGEA
jgi:glycosyltransferase involved in cell wall biosynthesis